MLNRYISLSRRRCGCEGAWLDCVGSVGVAVWWYRDP